MSWGMLATVIGVLGAAVIGVLVGGLWIWLETCAARRRRERLEAFVRRWK